MAGNTKFPILLKKKLHWYHIVYKVTKVEATSSLKYWASKPEKHDLHFGVHSCAAHVTRFLDFGSTDLGLQLKLTAQLRYITRTCTHLAHNAMMRKMNNYTALRPLTSWTGLPLCNMTQTMRFEQHLLFMEDRFRSFPVCFWRLQMCRLLVWLPPTPMAGFSYRLSLGFWFGFSLRISNGFW